MSKLIKADQCIEAHLCRLEPIDVDAFFINNGLLENETGESGVGETTFVIPEAAKAGNQANNEAGELRSGSFQPGERIDLSRLADFAGQLGDFISGSKEQESTANGLPKPTETPGRTSEVVEHEVGEHKVGEHKVAERNKDLTRTGARNQAEILSLKTKKQADSLLESAQSKSAELTEAARQQAGQMIESAQRKVAEFLAEAGRQADEITKQAEAKAAQLIAATGQQTVEMLEKAGQESLEIKNQARQEGFQAGHTEGINHAQQEYELKLADALALVVQAEAERLTRIHSSEPELLKLAAAIAEKIIGAELKTTPETQVAIVKQALAGISAVGTLIIKVNPADSQLFEKNLTIIQDVFHEPVPVKIQADQGITAGSCYIETEQGNIDARIKTQLEVISTEILKAGRLE